MTNNLNEVLTKIAEDYQDYICEDSRHYLEISLTEKAAELGFSEIKERNLSRPTPELTELENHRPLAELGV